VLPSCIADYPQPITLAADAITLPSVYRSLRTINRLETFTLFSRVTLIRKLQSTLDLHHFHARNVPRLHVKSHNDPISSCQGDSGVLFSLIYIYIYRFVVNNFNVFFKFYFKKNFLLCSCMCNCVCMLSALVAQ